MFASSLVLQCLIQCPFFFLYSFFLNPRFLTRSFLSLCVIASFLWNDYDFVVFWDYIWCSYLVVRRTSVYSMLNRSQCAIQHSLSRIPSPIPSIFPPPVNDDDDDTLFIAKGKIGRDWRPNISPTSYIDTSHIISIHFNTITTWYIHTYTIVYIGS